jgi:hypothetical protein
VQFIQFSAAGQGVVFATVKVHPQAFSMFLQVYIGALSHLLGYFNLVIYHHFLHRSLMMLKAMK